MPSDEWFRQTDWSPEIEKHFFAKLRRARSKDQYLRIQAYYLVQSHPRVALDLIRQFFELSDPFDRASAYWTRAQAYQTLGEVEAAVLSYREVFAVEEMIPNIITNAWLDFAMLVATKCLVEHYGMALSLLEEKKRNAVFPLSRFMSFSCSALILAAKGEAKLARPFALAALEAANINHSGVTAHPGIGLVGDRWEDLKNKLLLLV